MRIIFPPRNILVPIDMSKPSLVAIEVAKNLAKRFKARLDLVYVQDLPLSLLGVRAETESGMTTELAIQMEDFRRWREQRIRTLIQDFPPKRVRVRTVRGVPAPSLADVAGAGRADLIVMGTHGYTGFDRIVFGSVAESMVRCSKIPVLTVQQQRTPFKTSRILVPYNFQDYAKDAVLAAKRVADAWKARLTVLNVRDKETREAFARQRLEGHMESLFGKKNTARLQLVIRKGESRKEILQEAVSGNYDLIILAAHYKPFLSDWILGSTVERVLRHSPVPVLSIPSREKTGQRLNKVISGKIFI